MVLILPRKGGLGIPTCVSACDHLVVASLKRGRAPPREEGGCGTEGCGLAKARWGPIGVVALTGGVGGIRLVVTYFGQLVVVGLGG